MTTTPKIEWRNEQLADLAWTRYQTSIEEGTPPEQAFKETIKVLLETQDEAWMHTIPAQGEG